MARVRYTRLVTNVALLWDNKFPTTQETRLFVAQLTASLKALQNRVNATEGRSDVLDESPTTIYNPVEKSVSNYANIANPMFCYNAKKCGQERGREQKRPPMISYMTPYHASPPTPRCTTRTEPANHHPRFASTQSLPSSHPQVPRQAPRPANFSSTSSSTRGSYETRASKMSGPTWIVSSRSS